MSGGIFDRMRIWAMLTGLFFAGWYFGELSMSAKPAEKLAMLVMGIGGFEVFLFGQDLWLKMRRGRGHG